LGQLFQSVLPLPLVDLVPTTFVATVTSDPEHALENYVDLADRAWALGPLLRQAQQLRPATATLADVVAAYDRWDQAVRSLILEAAAGAATAGMG
jgi:hypothetical protein